MQEGPTTLYQSAILCPGNRPKREICPWTILERLSLHYCDARLTVTVTNCVTANEDFLDYLFDHSQGKCRHWAVRLSADPLTENSLLGSGFHSHIMWPYLAGPRLIGKSLHTAIYGSSSNRSIAVAEVAGAWQIEYATIIQPGRINVRCNWVDSCAKLFN